MSTKNNQKPVNEVGVIGQMYENRKTKKVGVLESRDEKFKTLMMRDNDGKSFNINFSTFRSDWRKYQGEEVIQTSTQIEEQKAEEKKEVTEAKKEVKKEKSVKMSTEDKVKEVKALTTIIENRLKASNSVLKVSRKAQGGIVIRYNKYTVFEAWVKYGQNKTDIFFRGTILDVLKKEEKEQIESLPSLSVVSVHDNWPLKYQYRFSNDNIEQVLDALISVGNAYAEARQNEKNEEKEKN
jgi:hypothetical protein